MKDAIDVNRLAIVLKHANSSPPRADLERESFYRLKQSLCEQYGTLAGYDMQHIADPCWGYRYDPCDEHCEKCGGTGIYHEKWVVLQRWNLGGLIFHRPLKTVVGSFAPATIEGRIRHKRSRLAGAAQRVLNLLFVGQWGFGAYGDLMRLPDHEFRRTKAVLTYLLGLDRRRWPGVRFRFADLEARIQAVEKVAIPF